MIYFLVLRKYRDIVTTFLNMTGGVLGGRVRALAYARLLARATTDFSWRQAKEAFCIVTNSSGQRGRRARCRALGPLVEHLVRCAGARYRFPTGTYVFADLERLSPDAMLRAAFLWDTLAGSPSGVRLLN